MVLGKTITITGDTPDDIEQTQILLQNFINQADAADVRKLLLAFQNNPKIAKKAIMALKFL